MAEDKDYIPFDGLFIESISGLSGDKGRALGVCAGQLKFGPQDLTINFGNPNVEGLNRYNLFWVENEGEGPYSKLGCYLYLAKEFSSFHPRANVVRVKPREFYHDGRKLSSEDYDFVFWRDKEPLSLGEQYFTGQQTDLYLGGKRLVELIDVWNEKNFSLYSCIVGKLNEALKPFEEFPRMKLNVARQRIETDARNSSFTQELALVGDAI